MNEAKVCFYCRAPLLNGSYQNDHFPIPARNGGKITVPACLPCHDMKDRMRFDEWPEEMVAAVMDSFPSLNRETRIMLAKFLAMASDIVEHEKSKCSSLPTNFES